jgi:hypothetical protein
MGVGVEPGSTDHGAGEPEAPPIPGQKDWSQPEFVLPPSLQRLLDVLKPQVPDTPKLPDARELREQLPDDAAEQVQPEALLDYLLAP